MTTDLINPSDERISAAHPTFIFNDPLPESVGSVPLQALIPARHIGAKALFFGANTDAEEFLDRYSPKILVITKMLNDGPVKLARAASRRGVKIVGVFCDLHVEDVMGTLNKELCDLSDAIVAPTDAMANFMEQVFGRPCSMIVEPVEYPRGTPKFSPGTPLRILWIGHANNHDTLFEGIRSLARFRSRPMTLMIVSSRQPDIAKLQSSAPNLPIAFLPWSPLIQFDMLNRCDVVFIPSNDTPAKRAKGQARPIAAIQAGRVAIAYPLPQYEPLSDFCFLGRDYAESLSSALTNEAAAERRVAAGQRYIDKNFSQEICADAWRRLIVQVMDGSYGK